MNTLKGSPKQIGLAVISFLIAVFNFLTPLFYIVKMEAGVLGTKVHNEVTGYSVLDEYPKAIEEIGEWLGMYTIIYLILSVTVVISLIVGFVKDQGQKFFDFAVATNVISVVISTVYLINGFSTVEVAKEYLGSYGEASTSSFIPFIFVAILAIAFFVIKADVFKKFIAAKPNNNSNNTDTIGDLERYKDLLDKGVISEEDFEAKKKQLLGL